MWKTLDCSVSTISLNEKISFALDGIDWGPAPFRRTPLPTQWPPPSIPLALPLTRLPPSRASSFLSSGEVRGRLRGRASTTRLDTTRGPHRGIGGGEGGGLRLRVPKIGWRSRTRAPATAHRGETVLAENEATAAVRRPPRRKPAVRRPPRRLL